MRRLIAALLSLCLLAAPSWAAIGRTALGTAQGTSVGNVFTLQSGLTIASGEVLVVFVLWQQPDGIGPDGANLGSQAMFGITSTPVSGDAVYSLYSWALDGPFSGDLIVTDQNSGGGTYAAVWEKYTGVGVNAAPQFSETCVDAPFVNVAHSSGTTPSVTSATATAQANEMIVTACGWTYGSSHGGAWGNGFTLGQETAVGGQSISEAYLNSTTAQSYTASRSAGVSTQWGQIIIGVKEASSSGTTTRVLQRPDAGVGGNNLTGRTRTRNRVR